MDIELRPWDVADAGSLLAAVRESPDLSTQLPVEDLGSVEQCRAYIARALVPDGPEVVDLAVSRDGEVVGNVGLSNVDRRHGTAWVYYWLATSGRGRGLASRGLATLAAWAFSELDLFRLELGHRVNNPASCRVATAAGFVPEGIERAKLRYGDERFDVETHARLRTDPAPALELVTLRR